MKGLSRRSARRPKPAMNVTPLVDVVLVLLIIFMIVIPAMEKGASVEVPSILNVDSSQSSAMEPFFLSLTATGEMYFDSERVTADTLETTLRDANTRQPGRRVVVKADRDARYGDARRLFLAAQRVGFAGVSLQVSQVGGVSAQASAPSGARTRRSRTGRPGC